MAKYEGLGSITVRLEVSYLLRVPAKVDAGTILVLTLHGFGSNPDAMLRLTAAALGEDCVIASLRARISSIFPVTQPAMRLDITGAHAAIPI